MRSQAYLELDGPLINECIKIKWIQFDKDAKPGIHVYWYSTQHTITKSKPLTLFNTTPMKTEERQPLSIMYGSS